MTRSTVVRWALPSVVAAALAILALWLTRPTWMVISENPSYTLTGTEDAAAITGTVLIALVLAAILFVTSRPASRARTATLVLLLVAIAIAFIGVNLALYLEMFPSSVRCR